MEHLPRTNVCRRRASTFVPLAVVTALHVGSGTEARIERRALRDYLWLSVLFYRADKDY